MHTVIPASRRRIPIAYFRACTWNLRGCFVKFLHPWYVLSALPIYVFVTYVCISHVYAYLLRSAQRSVANVRLATLTVNWTLKRRVFLKNTGAFPPLPPCVPTKEAFDRWNETPSFVCRTSPDSPCMSRVLSRATIFIMCTPNSLFALLPTRTNRIHSSLSSFHLFLSCPTRNNLYWRTHCRIGEFER